MSEAEMNFRLPGPTPLPPAVLEAMQRPMIPHRGPAFKTLFAETLERARRVHRTSGDVLIWPASGSAGWEIAITNLFAPGDIVIAAVTGNFGDRFAKVATTFGLDVRRVEIAWGKAITPDALEAALRENPDARGVLITHNETSTGVTNPLPELAEVARKYDALTVVDAVSSAGAIPLEFDDWDLDFVFSGSQKAWMCPPGLAIVAAGPRAWAATERFGFPRFFWDMNAARKNAAEFVTSTTPSLTLLYAYHAALGLILDEGIENVWARHAALGEYTRETLGAAGLRLFADPAYASASLTAFLPPEGVTAREFLARLREEHRVEAQAGQADWSDRMIRLGHMGWAHDDDIHEAVNAVVAVAKAYDMERHSALAGVGRAS